ncbi:phenylacetate-CoA ligase [Caldicellulosiruptor bescii]|uniref:Phenylacetate-coenzyme A ligase n=2 Tax=Caldicellulosiruptor bescii TaxID=31899 RepID=B9MJU7_CALBD|nr:phenylacetate--CoA ligase [Caldicellulosiruptor bescii]ACM60605.1 Phenylacetate--CoA ligase [Caldicellulosiruptor bescii DSM 6725]PBC88016.1 phenylacetate-CoA ligase [Caldicellulosiruptor bescii]PBC90948.1 phenylacetate-CoA ligase [Caldicellulosiruptor bescii]PBD03620.1 phenylacetate-CoA ligase [Caldicellulosiruptor bescii]PBD06746.1 phenylacetate-CoA ligase [Caldicellulosiruptor bescii]
MIWSEYEKLNRKQYEELQLERLKRTVERVYENVPFYRKKFDEIGVKPHHIKNLKDIRLLPFTTKDDLRENYPYGLFTVPLSKIVRIHASSGTTGKPTVVGYTKHDMEVWTEVVARIVTAAGVREHDIAQIAFGYGLFTGAFGLHQGLERVGATVIPISSGNTEKQLMVMQDFGATVLVCTPSYALYIDEVANELGIDKSRIKLRLGLFGAEASTVEMRREIEKKWGLFATENYGLSEIIGPGVSGECEYREGLHINEDHFYPEIINPDTGEVLEEGETGELVLTTITKEGMPLIRYRTRDITSLIYEPCKCGRTNVRMTSVKGRTDDMLIIRGVNVFPSQIESVLMGIEGIGPHYQLVVTKKGYLDDLEVHVELVDGKLLERYAELEKLENKIKHRIFTVLGLNVKVKLVEPKTLERTTGKAKRVIDLRNKTN